MSKLQLSLLALGALVILAVAAFNFWQERRYRRQAEAHFNNRHEDVLLKEALPSERREPVLEGLADEEGDSGPEPWLAEDELPPALAVPAQAAAPPDVEPVPPVPEVQPEHKSEPAPEAPPVALRSAPAAAEKKSGDGGEGPDPQTEYVVAFDAADPISALTLGRMLDPTKPAGKPVRWLGLCQRRRTWNDVRRDQPDAEYVRLAACMQLADRNGPVRADELEAFCDLTQTVAANLYAVVDCPSREAALTAAAELDNFCADVDVLIGINLISKDGGVFPGTKLRALAESAGMRLAPDGGFHYLDEHGAELFSLVNQETLGFAADTMKHLSTHGVTFLFDVPKAAGGVHAYSQMMLAVKQFVAPLGALVVDDNRKELTEAGVDKIRQQLAAIYQRMDGYGIGPGSARARRLFA